MAKKKKKKKKSQNKKRRLEEVAIIVSIVNALVTAICLLYETFIK